MRSWTKVGRSVDEVQCSWPMSTRLLVRKESFRSVLLREVRYEWCWPGRCCRRNARSHGRGVGVDRRVEAYSAFGPPFRKPRVSMSNLDGLRKEAGISDVFVVGLAYDFCVKATALDAAEFGYKTFVIEEGTKAVFQSEGALSATRKELEQAGVVVVGLDSAEVKVIKR